MSQKETILKHLQRRATITPLEAFHLHGVYRLSDVVMRLRRDGHNITTTMKKTVTGAEYGEYRLQDPKFSATLVKIGSTRAIPHSETVTAATH